MSENTAGTGRFRLVLVPEDQVTEDGCKPGMVKLTGTPGAGTWDEWGPYQAIDRDGLAAVLAVALGLGPAGEGTVIGYQAGGGLYHPGDVTVVRQGRVAAAGGPGPLPSPGEGDPG